MQTRTRRSVADEKCELDMTPMIDVTFLILIFFMCTLKFRVLEGKLGAHLPKDVGAVQGPETAEEPLKIRMDVVHEGTRVRYDADTGTEVPYTEDDAAQGLRFDFDETREVRYSTGAQRSTRIAEVRRWLEVTGPEVRVVLDPREGIVQQDVVSVLDEAVAAGVGEVTFAGARPE